MGSQGPPGRKMAVIKKVKGNVSAESKIEATKSCGGGRNGGYI